MVKSARLSFRVIAAVLIGAIAVPASAGETVAENRGSATAPYREPPAPITKLIDGAALAVEQRPSPDGNWILVMKRSRLLKLADVAGPSINLAGLSINPNTGRRPLSQDLGSYNFDGLELVSTNGNQHLKIANLPRGGHMSAAIWSPDSRRLSLIYGRSGANELWVIDVCSGNARRIGGFLLNAVAPSLTGFPDYLPCSWMPDSVQILCLSIPLVRPAKPVAAAVPNAPRIADSDRSMSSSEAIPPDVLTSAYDDSLFDFYATSQPILVNSDTGALNRLRTTGVFAKFSPSPDGAYFLSERLIRPYSRDQEYEFFTREIGILDRNGRLIRHLARLPLAPGGTNVFASARTGPRSFGWLPFKPARLAFVEAVAAPARSGDVDVPDRMAALAAPGFRSETEIFRSREGQIEFLPGRPWSSAFSADGVGLIHEQVTSTGRSIYWLIDILKRSPARRVSDTADNTFSTYRRAEYPLLCTNGDGSSVLARRGQSVFFQGAALDAEQGEIRPYIDRIDLASNERQRAFAGVDAGHEELVASLGCDGARIVTSLENPESPAAYFIKNLETDQRRSIALGSISTGLQGLVERRQLNYKRADGVVLGGDLFLPRSYQSGTRIPVIVVGYPMYTSDGQVRVGTLGEDTLAAKRFSYSFEPDFYDSLVKVLVAEGFGVFYADMPIVGDKSSAFHSYVDQIVANASAAKAELMRLGYTDSESVGVLGHSFGGTMAANLLAHSKLFAAGIAIDGMYDANRVPFTLGNVPWVSLWKDPATYDQVSVLPHAAEVSAPLLLIQGQADLNDATLPEQSEIMFRALGGLGKTSRLVEFPYEGHNSSIRETSLHAVWEISRWFNLYLKRQSRIPTHAINQSAAELSK